jgi:hypothetical protein
MLRPTLAEILTGLQRSIMQTMLPELSSPYAQQQATMAALVMGQVAAALEKAPAHDIAEIEDLKQSFKMLSPMRGKLDSSLQAALDRAVAAADANPVDRHAMEAAMATFTSALALARLDDSAAQVIRGYIRRNLDRMRDLLPTMWGT